MKATISANGILKILPETEVEAYALKCWGENNFHIGKDKHLVDSSNIIIARGAELPKKEEEW